MRKNARKKPWSATRSSEGVREEKTSWPGSVGLRCCQPKRSGKRCGDSEELDRDLPRRYRSRIASKPLLPAETRMRALCTGEDHVGGRWRSGGGRRQTHFETLVSHKLDTGTSVLSAAPISPEQGSRTDRERMQHYTDLTWLRGRAAVPLTLLAQRTRATTVNAGSIHHTQASISFSALFMCDQLLVCWTTQRPIRLEHKILAREATRFPGQAHLGRSIARSRGLLRLKR